MSEKTQGRYQIETKAIPTLCFIGVTTGKSSIMQLFPLWTKELGRPEVVIEGVDHKLHDDPKSYRQSVAQIKYDPLSLGALVTTHKIDLREAAGDMFDYLDTYAQITGEISCISKRDGKLEGYAKDPITAGRSLDAVLDGNYFARTGGEVLCIGAGGSGMAIALNFMERQNPGDRPQRVWMVNRSQGRLDKLAEMISAVGTDIEFRLIANEDPARNDSLMEALPEGSIVINATGMGKDRPGSPITNAGRFPKRGVVWEINYRGELDFMHQALAQREARSLTVEDGWLYFLHGWAEHISEVYHQSISQELFKRLGAIAETVRKK